MAEFIGPIKNRVLLNLLDQNFKSGSISAKEYRDLKKQFFGKPKLIQMELFPKDPKKKQKGGLMEQTNGLKKMGLKKGGRIRGPKDLQDKKNREKMSKLKQKLLQKRTLDLKELKKRKLTPQEKKDLMDQIKKEKGQLTNPFLKFNKLGQPYMEAKGGGLAAATAKLKAQGLKKGGFPDLSGDGKVTMKDILMGRGVIKKPKKKQKGGSMTLKAGKLRGVKDAPEEFMREKRKKIGSAMKSITGIMKGLSKAATGPVSAISKASARAGQKAGRLAKRGYGIARK
tara:strand:+ start:40 stop:891 length:852 start_codon:yes stop_codon:yes gene_type:complete